MGDSCIQILRIYAVFIVPVQGFGVCLTAGSRLEMALNILRKSTVDRGRHGPTCIILTIPGVGDGVIFGDLSLLERL